MSNAPRRGGVDGDDGGFVLVWLCLVLFALLSVAALSIDVGSWYKRADEVQRAADAAALAGVVYMPDIGRARAEAVRVAAKNGFEIGDGRITVDAEPGTDHQLRVTINDSAYPTLFGRFLMKSVAIHRSALAEYTQAINMGSPYNYLGAGDLWPWSASTGSLAFGYWLSVNGYCTAKEEGDFYLAAYDGNSPSLGCGPASTTTTLNDTYDPKGYVYTVLAPAGRSASISVDAYDPGYCPDPPDAIDRKLKVAGTSVTLTYRLTAPDVAGTPFDYGDDPVVGSGTFSGCTSYRTWVPLGTIGTSAPAGRYALQIASLAGEPESFGFNSFALRADVGGSGEACDSRVTAECPQVSGANALSIAAADEATDASFFLADIPAAYKGKTVVITLWDPGEGMADIELYGPGASGPETLTSFRYRVDPDPVTGTVGTFGSDVTALDVSGCTAEPQPGAPGSRFGQCLYNDRKIDLIFRLPDWYPGGWWYLNYAGGIAAPGTCQSGASVCDRTTWLVRIIGDPVHLTRG